MKNLKVITLIFSVAWALQGTSTNAQMNKTDKSIFTETMVEMTWEQVRDAGNRNTVVLLPVGIVEEHGPHMDLSPDIYLSVVGCRMVKAELAKQGIEAIIAPPFYWGISKTTDMFPGTFSISPQTFRALMFDIMGCLKKWGFKNIFVGNLHGDALHCRTITTSVQEIRDSLKINAYDLSSLPHKETERSPQPKQGEKMYKPDYHAGAEETKLIWDLFPDKVDVKKAKSLAPQNNFAPLGYVGDPANFEKGSGKELLQRIANEATQGIIDFLKKENKISNRNSSTSAIWGVIFK